MELHDLKQHRGVQKASLTRAITFMSTLDKANTSLITLRNKRTMVESHFQKFEEFQQEIEAKCADQADLDTEFSERDLIEGKYLEIVSAIDQAIEEKLGLQPVTPATPRQPTSAMHLKLPEIHLPTFDGKYEDWPSFEDLFAATIDKNSSLSGGQKLQYLKACTTGDAATLIRSFTITDLNYVEAWSLIKTRYSNNREIINSIIKKLCCQPRLTNESVEKLQTLLNCTLECIRSLRVLGRPTEKWDDIVVFLIVEKFDNETRSEWAKSITSTEPSTFDEVQDFLERHIRSLHAKGNSTTKSTVNPRQASNGRQHARTHHVATAKVCLICKGDHYTNRCSQLLEMKPPQRVQTVKKIGACLNCLRDGHFLKNCNSKSSCKVCAQRHHTLLHLNPPESSSQGTTAPPPPATGTNVNVHTSSAVSPQSQVLLKTAIVFVVDSFGNKKKCRVLLDDGSEASFISEACSQALGLRRMKTDVVITGISSCKAGHSKAKVNLRLWSVHHHAYADTEAIILPQVTGILPRTTCNHAAWTHLNGLELADEQFFEPSKIDILLGADVVAFIMREGIRQGVPYSPIAQNSIFGWVLSGKVNTFTQSIIRSNYALCKINEIVQRFWKVEEPPTRRVMTPEEAVCETHFKTTYTRLVNGRFQVRLPFNDKISSIGSTREQAMRRLLSLESRFKKNPSYLQQYIDFMREYESLGHMRHPDKQPTPERPCVYLPHHFVTKDDSTTSKLRVVFDGSAKSSNGISLNQTLLPGPTIQDDLIVIIIRFRLFLIAIKADIAKMYRQFEVHPDDQNCQRILWREDPNLPVKEYVLTTVTYGTRSAAFQAIRCLQQLASDNISSFPDAVSTLQQQTYVDDLMGGANSIQEANKLIKDLSVITTSGCLQFRKWCSNSDEVMQSIPVELRETTNSLTFDSDDIVKALGIQWQPSSDNFIFAVNVKERTTITKRELLSDLARVFDPAGWLSPTTIIAKIILQDLWAIKMDWDDVIPHDVQQRWVTYQNQLTILSKLKIPRCVMLANTVEHKLIGFSDASEKAYAAAIYLRVRTADGGLRSNLLVAKTKVAPLKHLSIPRLELSGAYLLAELMDMTSNAIKIKHDIQCFTDSMVVLKWIKSTSRRWKVYVANRVACIQEKVPSDYWHHVRSEDNPADAPSRGILPEELINSKLWWHGPAWLVDETFPITSDPVNMDIVIAEEKPKPILTHQTSTVASGLSRLIEKYSNLGRLVSAVAHMMRFIHYLKSKQIPSSKSILPSERKNVLHKLIKFVQDNEFLEDIKYLKKHGEIKPTSNIRQLYPFIDGSGLLRVGGRLQNSNVHSDTKHQIILPKKHHLTTLIIRDCHETSLHSGFTLTCCTLRQAYWILGARNIVKILIKCCIVCRKANAESLQQLMGSLPVNRVIAHRPFLHCGVDFAGPFWINFKRGRGQRPEKCYFAIFVCFATKACHLEAVTGLSTDAFIACYRRFTSRRGISSHLYCDNGTNFVGAERELFEALKQAENDLQSSLSYLGTTFIHTSASAPHQGGLWEAGVKSTKHHLKRVMGRSTLTFEQFQTLLCNVESCLNSRPICALSSDPTDIDALTPGHFLIGSPMNAVPDPDITLLKEGRLSYWQHVQYLSQHFWKRWHQEYLTSLQQRHKWNQKKANPEVGDLVAVRDDNLPPNRWKLGRITKTRKGQDGLVRNAEIRTILDSTTKPVKYSDITRPIQKLSPILHQHEN